MRRNGHLTLLWSPPSNPDHISHVTTPLSTFLSFYLGIWRDFFLMRSNFFSLKFSLRKKKKKGEKKTSFDSLNDFLKFAVVSVTLCVTYTSSALCSQRGRLALANSRTFAMLVIQFMPKLLQKTCPQTEWLAKRMFVNSNPVLKKKRCNGRSIVSRVLGTDPFWFACYFLFTSFLIHFLFPTMCDNVSRIGRHFVFVLEINKYRACPSYPMAHKARMKTKVQSFGRIAFVSNKRTKRHSIKMKNGEKRP